MAVVDTYFRKREEGEKVVKNAIQVSHSNLTSVPDSGVRVIWEAICPSPSEVNADTSNRYAV